MNTKSIDNNGGLLIGKRETDYRLGSSPIVKEEIITNWKDWKPEHEIQAKRYYDTLSCVTYSALDVLEYNFTWALHNNKISADNIKWLTDNKYFKNGLINFSERFTAILGETNSFGAYQYKVGDAIRHFGLIPDNIFNAPDEEVKSQKDFLDKTKITPEMYKLGEEFIKRFPVNYEWCNLKDGLKYGVVQVCVYYADGDGILCPTQNPNHAVVAISENEIDDSYSRQFKKYCPQSIYSPMLYTVKFNNNMFTFKKLKGEPHIYLVDDVKGTKMMIVDMETLQALGGEVEEVPELAGYISKGTLVWVNRIIN